MSPIESRLVLSDVLNERTKQVRQGYDASHDDEHDNEQLLQAALCFVFGPKGSRDSKSPPWPWDPKYDKIAKHRA